MLRFPYLEIYKLLNILIICIFPHFYKQNIFQARSKNLEILEISELFFRV